MRLCIDKPARRDLTVHPVQVSYHFDLRLSNYTEYRQITTL